jgi:DNA-binding response OmpR family regulator
MLANRILCVEDDADTRALLKKMLDMSDLEAAVVPDVYIALQMMERERFSLYVLDGGLRGSTERPLSAHRFERWTLAPLSLSSRATPMHHKCGG